MREFGEGNGVIYVDRPEDVVSTATSLISGGEAKELGRRGREFVEQYSWDRITDQYEQVLTEVVKHKGDGKT
jgi:glycosyltransferase involved in cell wall biosynthesis